MLNRNKLYCIVVNCKYHTTKDRCIKNEVQISTHESIARDFRSTNCMSFEHED